MDPPPLPRVPEALLGPLLQWTGETLRELKAQDVPPAVRPLLSFDRRGFGSAAAQSQLHRALEAEPEFRALVFGAMADRPDVAAALQGWDVARAVALAEDAAARDDLPVLASALVLARPEGWEVGIGVALAQFTHARADRLVEDDREAFETRVRTAQEARRRSEGEVEQLKGEVERIAAELRDERASRREREETLRAEVGEAERRVGELGSALAAARYEAEAAVERSRRDADRAAALVAEVREARADAARARAEADRVSREASPPVPAVPAVPEALEDAEPPVEGTPPVRRRRARVEVPQGMVGQSVEGLRAALTSGNPALVVDGYNVSMLAWGEEPPDAQRQRLCARLESLSMRTGRAVTVVFDGADVEGVRPVRRSGVRVVFSREGEEADDVVIREVRALPLERPAIVVSSDRTVQVHAEEAGAMPVRSDLFLELIRR